MKKNRLLASALAAVMSVSLLAGCSTSKGTDPSAGGTNAAGETAAPTTGTGPKEVVIDTESEPPELNSILTTSTGSGNILRHIVEGLVYLDPQDEPVAGIAESWDVSDDGLTYTFHLRQDSKWSNGEPVTAHDFVFAWTQLFTPATGAKYGATWAPLIKGAEEMMNAASEADLTAAAANVGYKAVDDYTLEVTLTNPYPYFLSVLAFYSFAPVNEKGYTEIGADNYAKEADTIITNGPYNMTSWEHESEIVLEKNPDYYAADTIKIDKITCLMMNDSNARLNSYQAGECDLIQLTGDQSALLAKEGKTVTSYDDGSTWYFEFQTTRKGLSNAKIRKAMTLAVDAQSFIDNVVKNNSEVAYSFTPTAINNGKFAAAVGKVLNRGDYAAAKALFEEGLAEEGLTASDLKLSIIADDTDSAGKYAAFFQEQWKTNLGIDVTVSQMPYKSRLERMQTKDFDIVMAGWGPDYNDPMTFVDLFVTDAGNNHTGWSNAEYDQLIKDAIKEPDAAKRTDILVKAENILLSDMPIGPIYNRKKDYITSDRLTGVVKTAFTDLALRWADVTE